LPHRLIALHTVAHRPGQGIKSMQAWETYWDTYYDDIMFGLVALVWTIVVVSCSRRWWLIDGLALAPPLLYPFLIVQVLIEFGSWPGGLRSNHYSSFWFSGANLILSFACFSRLYRTLGIIELSTGKRSDSLIDCMYFSLITWTTVGYGDFIPASRAARVLAAYQAIAGYFTMAAVFAAIVASFSAVPQPH
jgi:Ion channel